MKSQPLLLPLLTALLSCLAFPGSALGCSCVSLSSYCDNTWADGEVIFVGTVAAKIALQEQFEDGIQRLTDYEVRFSAVDLLRGASKLDKTMSVYTGSGGGDCGYPFAVGSRYLVYAFQSGGRLTTGICSQTAPAAMVSATIRELTMLRDHGSTDSLFGNIGVAPNGLSFESLLTIKPLANMTVHARGKNSVHFSALTDGQGGYAFASIPDSEYAIEEDLLPGLHKDPEPVVVDLRYRKHNLGCRVDSLPKPDGRISGRVTNAAGRGVSGFITLEPLDPAEASLAHQRGGLPGQDTSDGRFSLELLPPGTYRLLFNPKHGSRILFEQTIIWPNNGSGLKLEFGQHSDGLKFQLSPSL